MKHGFCSGMCPCEVMDRNIGHVAFRSVAVPAIEFLPTRIVCVVYFTANLCWAVVVLVCATMHCERGRLAFGVLFRSFS